MNIDLSGKVALVTGGSRGIGRACSLLLAEAGAKVVINYNTSGEQAEEVRREVARTGGEAWTVQADMGSPDEVGSLFQHIRKEFERLDILVNNAGIIRDNLLLALEIKDWDRVHDVNLRGPFLCTKYAVEMMMPRHAGKIINIASTGAVRGGRGQTNYSSAKGGLVSFTRACAVELAGKGIQVNAILPGMIVTDMSSRVRKRAGEKILEKIPLARFGQPADIAGLVVFLASDRAGYITGQSIPVDGGLSIA